MRKPPTLQTIADLVGVSKNTVSCALRNAPHISKATRERVRRMADELGYRPNPLVSAHMQSLRSGKPVAKTANLAFLHAFEDPDAWRRLEFCHELFLGAQERADGLGFSLDPVWAGEAGMTSRRLTRLLRARGVQGVVVGPMANGVDRIDLEWEHFAAAAMGFSLRRPALHRAGTHQFHSVLATLLELDKLGYRHMGMTLSASGDAKVDYAWTAGLAVATAAMPDRAPPVILRIGNALAPEFGRWMRKHRPDVLVNAGVPSIGAALEGLGLSVPRDIGLVSLNGSAPVATVARDWEAIGAAAIDLVVSQLFRNERGIPTKPKTVMIEGEWSAGRTVRQV